ncbi:hypothetical protein B0J15DRAFT_567158 [Fusarium solani]|uniref:Uncharacterized protein n=1 Tax=Fusarium solani TaxID=169388 RepID=A0A9P9RD83_FUSSL|nr:uncharacterized protein B0J15DRAFT_567158 [Fusarium solani]KAH7273790.1 hypothetical protein B0J15DRAFT_567158 [Fusarium solani]
MFLLALRHILPILGLVLSLASSTEANADKVIFTAPDVVPIPLQKPSLADLNLPVLTPDSWSIRTNLSRVFPTKPKDYASGAATWLLLDSLNAGQRYEFRQPTGFVMDVYELDTVWDTPELMQSLADYAYSRQSSTDSQGAREEGERSASVLLLQIKASADYFTDDAALMRDPPPVLVDLILDPYLYNLIPRSLVPTIGFLILVGLVAWFVARSVASKLQSIAVAGESREKKEI